MKGRDFARRALEVAADDRAVLSNATQAVAYFGEMCSRSMSPTCRSSCCCNGRWSRRPGRWLHLVVTVIGAILGTVAFANWVILLLPYARRVF